MQEMRSLSYRGSMSLFKELSFLNLLVRFIVWVWLIVIMHLTRMCTLHVGIIGLVVMWIILTSVIGPELVVLSRPFKLLMVEVRLPRGVFSACVLSPIKVVRETVIILLLKVLIKIIIKCLCKTLGLFLGSSSIQGIHQVVLSWLFWASLSQIRFSLYFNMIPSPWIVNHSMRLSIWVFVWL
jgi:hypothetical protein